MEKLLIITYYWPPAGGPGVQRWLKFSKYLPQHGFEPYVLTVDPKFATYPITDESLEKEVSEAVTVIKTETREFFGAYKKATNRKEVPFSGFASEKGSPGLKERLARFVRGNFFYPDPRKKWLQYAVPKALELIKTEGIKVVVTTGPPHSTHLIGLELKKRSEVKWLADFRDPWTDIYYYRDFYPTALTRKLESALEMKVLSNADLITTASPGFANLLGEKLGSTAKLLPVTNGFDSDDIEASGPSEVTDRLVITYTGTLSLKYPLHTLIDALKALPVDVQKNIVLNIVGKLDQGSEELLQAEDLQVKVNLPGYVSHSEVMKYLQASSHVLLLIPMLKGNEGIIPAKLFEYIGSGKKIIGIGPLPSDAAHIIQQNGFGAFYTPEQANELKAWLLEPESEGATQQQRDLFSRHYLTAKLAEAIKQRLY